LALFPDFSEMNTNETNSIVFGCFSLVDFPNK